MSYALRVTRFSSYDVILDFGDVILDFGDVILDFGDVIIEVHLEGSYSRRHMFLFSSSYATGAYLRQIK